MVYINTNQVMVLSYTYLGGENLDTANTVSVETKEIARNIQDSFTSSNELKWMSNTNGCPPCEIMVTFEEMK